MIDAIVISLPAGTVVKIAGIPIILENATRIRTNEDNWNLIMEWECNKEPREQAERIKTAKRVL